MTVDRIRGEIERLITLLLEAGKAIAANPVIIANNGGTRIVTWRSDGLSGYFNSIVTVEEYLEHVRTQNYSFMMYDGAIVQCSYTFRNNNIVKHRLVYIPCPVSFDPDELEEESLVELVEKYLYDPKKARIEPTIRFDFDPENATQTHPETHLHLSRECCRIPVKAPLSLGHFVQFLFSNFYPDIYANVEELRQWPCNSLGSSQDFEAHRVFVGWRLA